MKEGFDMRHYFIGVPIPAEVDHIAETFTKDYSLDKNYKVLTHREDLHVTLLFLGAVGEEKLPAVKNTLVEIAGDSAPFSITINGLSYFGSSNGPRVVYLAVEENKALRQLQQEINDKIPDLVGIPKTDRFVPHVTIAKKRKTQEKLIIDKQMISSVEVPVPSFSLFTIHPAESPKYEVVSTFSFR